MIYAETSAEVMRRRRLFLAKWRLKCRAVADSLEKAGDQGRNLGTDTLIPVTDAIERLHEEFKRRIKTQTVLPSAETAAMLFWSLLASGQITMRKVDGWQTLGQPPPQCILISLHDLVMFAQPEPPPRQLPHHPQRDRGWVVCTSPSGTK